MRRLTRARTRSCRVPRVCVGQPGWRPVMLAAVGPARARGAGAAQRAGQPVPACHAPGQVRGVGGGHPGRGDEQRTHRGSPLNRHRAGSRAEPGRGHPGHRDAGLGVDVGAESGPARAARGGGARAGRTHPAGGLPGGPRRRVRPARARRRRRPAGLPPGPAGAQVMHGRGHAQAAVRGPPVCISYRHDLGDLAWRAAAWSVEYLVLTDTRLLRVRGVLIRTVNMMPLRVIAEMQFERRSSA
jgi:hypothetical protein